MDHILVQIGVLAAGIAGGNALIRLGSAGAHKMRSAYHQTSASDNYNQQAYYQPMNGPSYPYYQPSGYYQRSYPSSYYR
jgi:hypothetical protein